VPRSGRAARSFAERRPERYEFAHSAMPAASAQPRWAQALEGGRPTQIFSARLSSAPGQKTTEIRVRGVLEMGPAQRFPRGQQIASYLGLIPSEWVSTSSPARRKRTQFPSGS